MNDLDYLNQISAEVNSKATKPSLLNLFGDKTKYIFGAIVLVLILFIVLAVSSSSSKTENIPTATSELGRLYVRSEALIKTISEYNPKVSKPSIRSTGSSFSTLLTDISATASSHLAASGVKADSLSGTADDTALINELNANLEAGRLNGTEILNRTYANEMYYQIRYLMTIEKSIIDKTTNQQLRTYLETSKASAEHLGDAFKNYSEN